MTSLAPDAAERQAWWHPVAAVAELGDRPLAVAVFGEPLVLWRDPVGGGVQAFVDRCPHRGARLSLGQVRTVQGEGRIACPYHGWQFAADGGCRAVPALPGFEPPAAHAVRRYATRQACGLVWVHLGDGPPPALTVPTGVPSREVVCGPYDVATSAPRLVENFLDTSHFAFVHAGWLGDAGHPEVPAYEVATDAGGAPGVPSYRAWQPQASAQTSGGAWVDYRYQVLSPYTAMLAKRIAQGDDSGGLQDAYLIAACPVTDETSRVWFTQFTSDQDTPAERLQAFQHEIFMQDQLVLESQQPRRLPVALPSVEVHSAADRLSAAYRRYLRERGVVYGVC